MDTQKCLLENLHAGVQNVDSQALFPDPTRLEELKAHWNGLHYLGLELNFTAEALECNHPDNGFRFKIPYAQADSEDLRRQLFAELRKTFGGFTDRYLAVLFQPSREIDKLFDSFRSFLPLCRTLDKFQIG